MLAKLDTEQILALLRRRPCSIEDIASGLGIPAPEVAKQLDVLCDQRLIEPCRAGKNLYYRSIP